MKAIPVYKEENAVLQAHLAANIPAPLLTTFNSEAEQLGLDHQNPLKLSIGDKAPLFELPNAVDKMVSLQDLLNKGAVVITFYRGNWCPYCNLVLSTYQRTVSEINALGATLVAISPQNPDSSLSMQEKHALTFEVLSDKGNQVAKQFTTIIKNSVEAVEGAKQLGVDFYASYDDQSRDIPVPAVFIINKDGIVVFAKSEGGDFRLRVEPQDILDALKEMAS